MFNDFYLKICLYVMIGIDVLNWNIFEYKCRGMYNVNIYFWGKFKFIFVFI